jgi:hypothetical protein
MKNLFKIFGLVLIVSLNSQSFFSQGETATNFETKSKQKVEKILTEGNYTYLYKGKEVSVEIKDGYFKEKHENNEFIKAKIKWISENEYSLTITDIKKQNLPFKRGTLLKTKITKVKNNEYYYESDLNGLIWTGKLIKE